MTSEVVIANNQCVVMAADSAVTTVGSKVHDSALKLFSLSKTAPVGIMIYGSASYLGTPWETIIKVFREELGDNELPTLKKYCDDFIKHLDKRPYWSKLRQELWIEDVTTEILENLKSPLTQYISECARRGEKITEPGVRKVIEAWFNEKQEEMADSNPIYRNQKSTQKIIEKSYENAIKKMVSSELSFLGDNVDNISNLIKDIICYLVNRPFQFESHTGIVIAGYGKTQLYPQIITINFDGVIDDKPRHWKESELSADLNDETIDAVIFPFAQDDVIKTLVYGISPWLNGFIHSNLTSRINQIKDSLSSISEHIGARDTESQKSIDELSEKLGEGWDEFIDECRNFVGANYTKPMFIATSSLTKADMAMMAETLVNVTAFKRKISPDANSVGGPVDVAVLSKGDGLVWVKRKHYFPSDLNYHFFQNYLRGY